jgi:type II secretion system protein H
MPTSTRATSRRQHGFTLIELSLVLLIMGILLTLAVPRIGLIGEARLDAAAEKLAATLSYIHDEAALRGRIYRIQFDLDRESWSVESQAPFAEGDLAEGFVPVWDPFAEPTLYQDGLELVHVNTASNRSFSGTANVYFMPEGAPGGVVVRIADGERSIELEMDSVTGRVEMTRQVGAS